MDKQLILKEFYAKRKLVQTDYFQMSILELGYLYKDKEIIFVEKFLNDSKIKNNIIEAILLNIPMASIYAIQHQNGILKIIGKVQCLLTIFNFMGILKNSTPMKLENLKLLPMLNNLTFKDLPLEIQQIIKRTTFTINISQI